MRTGKRILVVDDDESIREFVEMALTDDGYEVATAADGAGALAVLEGFDASLILLDMRMAGMDGWSFAEAYKRIPGRAPILVLTAARDAAVSAAEIEADAFLAKPFELRQLLGLVARLVR